MVNQYFMLDFLGLSEPLLDDGCSAQLQKLRAGRDFVPGNPLVIEYYHADSIDRESKKCIKRPNALMFFNTPQTDQDGKITATAEWPYKTAEEFAEYLKQTAYCQFVDEHWSQGDFDSKFTSSDDFQVVRFR